MSDPSNAVFRVAAVLMVGLATTTACGGEETVGGTTAIVRDSAGIEIVELGDRSDAVYRVAEPVYRIGWDPGVRYFDTVRRALLLSDGRAAVADFGPREIVMIAPDGSVEAVLGGDGEGPEDLGLIWSMARIRGDTLIVRDNGNARLAAISPDGEFETYPIDPFKLRLWQPAYGMGSRLVYTPSGFAIEFDEPWLQMPIILGEFGTENYDTVGTYDFVEKPPTDVRPSVRNFGRIIPASDSLIVYTRQDRAEVRILSDDGRLVRVIRWNDEPAAVTDSIREATVRYWRDLYASVYEGERLEEFATGRAARLPETLPVIGEVLGDRDGRIWITDHAVDQRYPRWWVLDASGRELGWVEGLPPGLNLQDTAGDLVLGVEHNEFREEAASLFRLAPPG